MLWLCQTAAVDGSIILHNFSTYLSWLISQWRGCATAVFLNSGPHDPCFPCFPPPPHLSQMTGSLSGRCRAGWRADRLNQVWWRRETWKTCSDCHNTVTSTYCVTLFWVLQHHWFTTAFRQQPWYIRRQGVVQAQSVVVATMWTWTWIIIKKSSKMVAHAVAAAPNSPFRWLVCLWWCVCWL